MLGLRRVSSRYLISILVSHSLHHNCLLCLHCSLHHNCLLSPPQDPPYIPGHNLEKCILFLLLVQSRRGKMPVFLQHLMPAGFLWSVCIPELPGLLKSMNVLHATREQQSFPRQCWEENEAKPSSFPLTSSQLPHTQMAYVSTESLPCDSAELL